MIALLATILVIWTIGFWQLVLNALHIPRVDPQARLDGTALHAARVEPQARLDGTALHAARVEPQARLDGEEISCRCDTRETPLVSVIVPARNEAAAIERALDSLGGQSHPSLEVLLVNDGSTDGTGEIARRVAARHERVRVIDGGALREGWLGKPNAMRQGVEASRGELLVFTDADVVHHPRSIEAAHAMLDRRGLDLLSALPRVEGGGLFEDLVFGAALALVPCLPLWLANLPLLRRSGAAAGAFIMVRRSAFERAGGLEAIRRAFVDDVAIGRNVKLAGGRTALVRGEGIIRVRPFPDGQALVAGSEKNVFVAFRNSMILATLFMILPVLLLVVMPFLLWPILAWSCIGGGAAVAPLMADTVAVAFLLNTATVVFLLVLRTLPVLGQDGFRWWLVPTLPVGALVWIGLVLKAAFKTKFHGRTRWRGRDYAPGSPMG